MPDTCKWRINKCIFRVPWTIPQKASDGDYIPADSCKLLVFIPNICHANFWQLGAQVHHQEEEAMLTLCPCSHPAFCWWIDHFHRSSRFFLGKLRSSDWRDCPASDSCLSMLHVDCNQETPSAWCHVVSELGTWLFRHHIQCPAGCCSNMEYSGQRHRCQVLQHSHITVVEATPQLLTPTECLFPEYYPGSFNDQDEVYRKENQENPLARRKKCSWLAKEKKEQYHREQTRINHV